MAGRPNRRGWGWIRKLPSKRYQASYVGPDDKRHNAPSTYTVRMDAEAWLAAERRLIELDTWTPPAARMAVRKAKTVTLAEYAQRWIDHRTLKPRTRNSYQALLDRHIASSTIGTAPLKDLTPEAVRSWHSSLGPGHPTINAHAYGLLHAVCVTAVTDGALLANPCAIRRAIRAARQREPVLLTVPEVAALADKIEPQRLRALVLISAWCGLRWGEVSELRRKDIGEGAEVITVARGVTHRRGCRIDTPKSGKGRAVVVPPHIRADIEAHLDAHVLEDAEALLFPAPRGGCHLDGKMFRGHFNTALKSIGREGVRVHDLRHFAGTQTARVGNLVESMARLGHSTVSASLLYQQRVSGRDAEIAEALSKLAEDPATQRTRRITQPG